MRIIIWSTIVSFVFAFEGKSQTPYTLTTTDVTIVNGIITSSTLTDANGDNYQPDIIIPEMLDGQIVTAYLIQNVNSVEIIELLNIHCLGVFTNP